MNIEEIGIQTPARVFLIDDDKPVLNAVSLLMKSAGLECENYSSAQDYLDKFDPKAPGCVVTDLRMPGLSGLDLQEQLSKMEGSPPVILITGHGDVKVAVKALKHGAVDFIEKPFVDDVLIKAVNKAIKLDLEHRRERLRFFNNEKKLAQLTEREMQVLDGVVAGKPNKIIADDLNLSIKTVEYHRSNVMSKLEVISIADLVKLVVETRTQNNSK